MISEKFNAESRFNVIESGRQTGKTRFAIDLVQKLASEKGEQNILVVCFFRSVENFLKSLNSAGHFHRVRNFVDFNNGSRIYITNEENLKYMIGMGFDYVVLDECQRPETFNFVRPMVADKRGGMLVIGTDVWDCVLKHHSKVT